MPKGAMKHHELTRCGRDTDNCRHNYEPQWIARKGSRVRGVEGTQSTKDIVTNNSVWDATSFLTSSVHAQAIDISVDGS
jgi:hypothetical protein